MSVILKIVEIFLNSVKLVHNLVFSLKILVLLVDLLNGLKFFKSGILHFNSNSINETVNSNKHWFLEIRVFLLDTTLDVLHAATAGTMDLRHRGFATNSFHGETFSLVALSFCLFDFVHKSFCAKHGCFTRPDSLEDLEHVAESENTDGLTELSFEELLFFDNLSLEWSHVFGIHLLNFNEILLDVLLNLFIIEHHLGLSFSSELVHNVFNDVDAKCLLTIVVVTEIDQNTLDLVELIDVVS